MQLEYFALICGLTEGWMMIKLPVPLCVLPIFNVPEHRREKALHVTQVSKSFTAIKFNVIVSQSVKKQKLFRDIAQNNLGCYSFAIL